MKPQDFLIQKALPFPMTPKQYVGSEQSMSITENDLIGTVPSFTTTLVRGRPLASGAKRTPGEGGEGPSVIESDSAAARMESRTESDDNMAIVKKNSTT